MLVMLPEQRHGLEDLLHELQWFPLSNIIDALKTTAVYAVVPSFTTVKHVNLGPALQQVYITD